MRRALAALLVLLAVPAAAQDDPPPPLAWGERAQAVTTVCLERWHAIRVRDLRNASVARGEGAMAQIAAEKQALFQGRAWCFTDRVGFAVVDHPDVVGDARTWVKVADPDGPEDCPEGLNSRRCRWTLQVQQFVEATVEHPDVPADAFVYVATPRPIVPPADADKS